MRLLCQGVDIFAILRDTVKLFSMRLNQFAFLPAVYENAHFPNKVAVKLLDFYQYDR